jgi:hypothetical protein
MSENRHARRQPAVLLGAGINLIEVIRSLAFVGIPSAIVAPDHDAARLSRHATTITTRNWSDPQYRVALYDHGLGDHRPIHCRVGELRPLV